MKHARQKCLGFYHPSRQGEQPWIEIVVDNIIGAWFDRGIWRFLAVIPILRNVVFADTLYHEGGHHLDRTIGPLAAGSESTAEAWSAKLFAAYFREYYWYLVPPVPLAKTFVPSMRRRRH